MRTNRTRSLAGPLLLAGLWGCGATTTSGDAASGDGAAVVDGGAFYEGGTLEAGTASEAGAAVYDPFDDPAQRSPATAITAPDEQWTWVPFGDAVCANGQSSGLAVNLTRRSDRVMIFMMGGGACWDALTCYSFGTATNITEGYDADAFASERRSIARAPFFDRENERNPWRDASYVFVPYCTGDAFTGRNVRAYATAEGRRNTFFMGYRNVEVFLRRLVPTFAGASRVWLTGSSAGGFGAGFNWEQVQRAFGATRVDVVDDSGPPFDAPSRWGQWRAAWNVQLPADCAECPTRASAIVDYYARRYGEGRRFALLSYTRDRTISAFFGLDGPAFEQNLEALADRFAPNPFIQFFVVSGTSHTMLGALDTLTAADGTRLSDWLGAMVRDEPSWRTVRP